ncbi:hypothetical protein BJ322DRAFT_809345 [Thelephora terrestris]|uniref:Thiaminase-2/PQQC domain-containing protein n=1 Tax=Thelephora terrestris TaxID=56493 RepID=A0A9P6HDT9_9AGAM|nr:hypothetical protein BJ322DRAFT_809345 [Thelephora terrestris]
MNCVVAESSLVASPKRIEEGLNESTTRAPVDMSYNDDLVARLICDNQDLWKRMLNNPFCKKMKRASKDDQAFSEGFERYMIQDFHYSLKLITFETARACKALDSAEFDVSLKRIKGKTDYASVLLNTCVSQSPSGLGVEMSTVLGACESDALKSYTDFQISTAYSNDWVVSLVAMVPCIQSYFQIAMDLRDSSAHKDTAWYNLWVLENAKYESSILKQRSFFMENSDRWKDQYEKANEIFRKSCQGEIDFWEAVLNSGA